MEYYAGLDVSLKEISICVVDGDGKTIARDRKSTRLNSSH